MLDVKNLSVSYGQHRALENAAIHVGRGEIVVILGANGAGKSTLLKAISGICEGKTTGSVTLQGNDLLGTPANRIVEAGIALVPEGRGVFPDLTVRENLTLGAHSARARDDEETNLRRVYTLFPKLEERRRQIVRTMSGGEQQMVAIGRAMMSSPTILTLDEPSLGLSPLLCKELFQSLRTVRKAGIGILLVEQNAKQSLAIADRGYLLENGQIVHEAEAQALMNDPAVQKAYLGGAASAQAPVAHAPAAHAPSSAKAPMPQQQKPATQARPTAPRPASNPSDIAAAAMQKFDRRPAQTESAPATPRPSAPAPQHAQHASPPPRPAAPRPAATNGTRHASDILGTGIEDLVARAAAKSAERVSPRPRSNGASAPAAAVNGHALATMPQRAPATPTPSAPRSQMPKMPDLSDTQDRLKSVLAEMEEAAARARAYRPNRDR